jgi:hypothetical protein
MDDYQLLAFLVEAKTQLGFRYASISTEFFVFFCAFFLLFITAPSLRRDVINIWQSFSPSPSLLQSSIGPIRAEQVPPSSSVFG